jgi:hypothetical protein
VNLVIVVERNSDMNLFHLSLIAWGM